MICILVKWPFFALSAGVLLWRAPEKLLVDPDGLRLWHNPNVMLHCCTDHVMNAKLTSGALSLKTAGQLQIVQDTCHCNGGNDI